LASRTPTCALCDAVATALDTHHGASIVCTVCLRRVLGLARPRHWPVPHPGARAAAAAGLSPSPSSPSPSSPSSPEAVQDLARLKFQPALATKMAQASALCYTPESEMEALLEAGSRVCGDLQLLELFAHAGGAFGFLAVDDAYRDVHEEGDASAGGASSPGALVLCFRGTVTLRNIAVDLKATTTRLPPGLLAEAHVPCTREDSAATARTPTDRAALPSRDTAAAASGGSTGPLDGDGVGDWGVEVSGTADGDSGAEEVGSESGSEGEEEEEDSKGCGPNLLSSVSATMSSVSATVSAGVTAGMAEVCKGFAGGALHGVLVGTRHIPQAHDGFLAMWCSIRAAVLQAVKHAALAYPGRPIIITGYGARASGYRVPLSRRLASTSCCACSPVLGPAAYSLYEQGHLRVLDALDGCVWMDVLCVRAAGTLWVAPWPPWLRGTLH
jgi:hypothetical protein